MDDDQVLALLESGENIPAKEHDACLKRINAICDSMKYVRASSLFERPKRKAHGSGPHF